MLAHEELLALLHYSPETGEFTWRSSRSGVKRSRQLGAGTINRGGYRLITIRKTMYYAHRLAWFYMTGKWPTLQIDHANGIRDDNRFMNLREATQSQQSANSRMPDRNTTGFKGVTQSKTTGKFIAQIAHDGRYYKLGYYDTAEEAAAVRSAKAKKLHKDFARD